MREARRTERKTVASKPREAQRARKQEEKGKGEASVGQTHQDGGLEVARKPVSPSFAAYAIEPHRYGMQQNGRRIRGPVSRPVGREKRKRVG
jgi:hypothetical protein